MFEQSGFLSEPAKALLKPKRHFITRAAHQITMLKATHKHVRVHVYTHQCGVTTEHVYKHSQTHEFTFVIHVT